jgi:hypothetical protein
LRAGVQTTALLMLLLNVVEDSARHDTLVARSPYCARSSPAS